MTHHPRWRITVTLVDGDEKRLYPPALVCGFGSVDELEDWPDALGEAVGNFVSIANRVEGQASSKADS